MRYSDAENAHWYRVTSKTRLFEILGTMLEKSSSVQFTRFVTSLTTKCERGEVLSSEQIESIRKWDN